MKTIWDSHEIDPRDRSDALRQTIRDHVVDVELDLPPSADEVRARVALQHVGRLQICSVAAMPTVVTRTPRRSRADSQPSLFVTLQVQGSSMMVQHGREAVLGPGDLAVYATTEPYTLMFADGVRSHFLRVPLPDLALPSDLVRDVSARRLDPGDPVVRVASHYLRGLAGTDLGAGVSSLALPTVELLRAALLHTARRPDPRELGPLAESLTVRVEAFVARNLRDPALSATSIARAHHVSVRQVYAALAAADLGLGDLIREGRLEGARRALGDPSAAARTISAVARTWCFPSATHFSRVFRKQYGMSPREWRDAQLHG